MDEICTKQDAIEYVVQRMDGELETLKAIFSKFTGDHDKNLRWAGYLKHILDAYTDEIAILTEIEVSPDNKDLSDMIKLYKIFRTKTTGTNESTDKEAGDAGGQYI